MKTGAYGDILYESREEMEEVIDLVIEKVVKNFIVELKLAVKMEISDEEIEEELWGLDALQSFISERWATFEPDIGNINTEHEDE